MSFPDQEVAEEMVKVHSFKPAVFLDTEVKMSVVKQPIGLTTPVLIFVDLTQICVQQQSQTNELLLSAGGSLQPSDAIVRTVGESWQPGILSFTGSGGVLNPLSVPQESPALVGWKHLVAIRNVPDSPAGSREVLRLMRRFGTVIKSLVVSNMVRRWFGPTVPAFRS